MNCLIFSPQKLPEGNIALAKLSSAEANRVRNEDIGLFPLKLQNPHVSLERLSQYKVARQCLSFALRSYGIEVEDWSRLKQVNFAELQNYPHIQASLAHTRNEWGLAWVSERTQPIGVDLEKVDRDVKEKAEKHFLQKNEREDFSADTSLLSLWSIKEACFKAASPILQKDQLVLKDLRLKADGDFSFEGKSIGGWKQIRQSFLNENFLISFAWIHES